MTLSSLNPLSPAAEFALKRHLIYDFHHEDEPHSLMIEEGGESFKNTAIKIEDSVIVHKYFQDGNYESMPFLSEGNYLVASVPGDILGIYRPNQIKKIIEDCKSSPPNSLQWKVLRIPTDILNQLKEDVDLENRYIYENLTSKEYNTLSKEEKYPIYYEVSNVWKVCRMNSPKAKQQKNLKNKSACILS